MATHLAERTMPRFSLRCWGDFALLDAGGNERRPRGRKARGLIAYLALHPDRRVSRERLSTLLWGDRAEEQARSSLRQSLFELRDFGNGHGLLAIDREAVSLCGAALETDIESLRRAADRHAFDVLLAELPDPDERLFANLDDLAEDFDLWLRTERTRQHDNLVALIADASAQALATGDMRAARALHARLLAFEPDEPPLVTEVIALRPAPLPPSLPDEGPSSPGRRNWLLGAGAAVATGGALAFAWPFLHTGGGASQEARSLVQTADTILYERKAGSLSMAVDLLKKATALDPGLAPAWSGLAAATAMSSQSPDAMVEAERLARRAIAIDPKLGKAHGVLGMVLGFQSSEARGAIRRAAALDPDNPEILFWLSNVHGGEGNFPARLNDLRKAAKIDPLWHRSSGTAALAAYELGYEVEAQQHIDRVGRADERAAFLCDYSVDWARGDYAEVVRTIAALRPRLQQSDYADWKLGNALLVLGHVEPARLLLRMPPELWEVARGGPPSPAAFVRINREADLKSQSDFCFETALRQMVKAGRGAEIAPLFDAREGRVGGFARDPIPGALFLGGVNMALALRQAGRTADSERLLDDTEAAMRRTYGFGRVPNCFEARAAQLWAARGRPAEAVAALGRSVNRGWHYAPVSPLPDIADIPAFASLVGNPEFETYRARLKRHIESERKAVGGVPV